MQSLSAERHLKTSRKNHAKEIYFVFGILLVLISILFLFSSQSWPVWSDEVLLTDPAANLFLGNGFTSSAWYFQSKEEFWACNAPLHAIFLFLWIKVFGLNIVSVRAFNYVLIGIASLFMWATIYRTQIIPSAKNRLIFVSLVVFSQSVSFSYLSGRYDCLAITLFSGAAFAYTLRPSWTRNTALLSVSALISAAGFHLLPYATIILFLLYIFIGKAFFKPAIWIVLGLSLGLLSVLSVYAYQGVFSTFIETVGGHSLSHIEVPESAKSTVESKIIFVLGNFFPILGFRLQEFSRWYTQDISFGLLLLASLLSLVLLKVQGVPTLRSPLTFGLTVGLVVPLAMGLFRNYPDYYTWMATIPLCLGVASSLPSKAIGSSRNLVTVFVFSLLVAAMLVGLPRRLLPVVQHLQASRYGVVEDFVQSHVKPEDKVFSDFGPYYAIKKQVGFVLFPTYLGLMSQAEKDQLDTLLLDTKQFHHHYKDIDLFSRIDGEWYETGETLETPQYNLKIFRRALSEVAIAPE